MNPPINPFVERTIQWLNTYEENLWFNLDHVPHLRPEMGDAILAGFLEQACQCQNVGNIDIGFYGILAIPKEWVLQHIEVLAEPLLQLEDEWEYSRLFEVYLKLDKALAKRLALRGISSHQDSIQETGKEFLESLNR